MVRVDTDSRGTAAGIKSTLGEVAVRVRLSAIDHFRLWIGSVYGFDKRTEEFSKLVWITPGIPITDVLLIPQSPVVNAILKMIHHPCHVSIEGGNLQTVKNDISRKGWGHTASSYALSKSHGSCHPDLSYGSVDY